MVLFKIGHVWCHTIKYAAHGYFNTTFWYILAENSCTVGFFEYGLAHILSNLPLVDVKGSNHLYVRGCVAPYIPVHQSDDILGIPVFVIVYSLYKGACTITNTNYRYLYLFQLLHLLKHRFKTLIVIYQSYFKINIKILSFISLIRSY